MPTVDDVQFDTTGWEQCETIRDRITWINANGDVLIKRYTPGAPKMPGLFRSEELRQYYVQQVTVAGGALLSIDLMHIKGAAISKMLFKVPQATGLLGFLGTLNLAYRDFSYSIRVQALERPGDEARSQRAWEFLEQSQPPGTDLRTIWYGERVADGDLPIKHCLADDEHWDTEFPRHPLSRIRAEFARLVPTLQVSRDVKNSVPHNS